MPTSQKTQTENIALPHRDYALPRDLLVEDEKPMRDIIVPWLLADGFDCREVADAMRMMELLATEFGSTLFFPTCCYLK